MDEEECIHGMWPASTCTICNGKDAAVKEAQSWRVFESGEAGYWCAVCNFPIKVGEMVAYKGGERVRHEGCL